MAGNVAGEVRADVTGDDIGRKRRRRGMDGGDGRRYRPETLPERDGRRRGPARGTLHIVSKADNVEKAEGAAVLNFGNVQNSGSWLPLLMKSESDKKATRGNGRRYRPETSPGRYSRR